MASTSYVKLRPIYGRYETISGGTYLPPGEPENSIQTGVGGEFVGSSGLTYNNNVLTGIGGKLLWDSVSISGTTIQSNSDNLKFIVSSGGISATMPNGYGFTIGSTNFLKVNKISINDSAGNTIESSDSNLNLMSGGVSGDSYFGFYPRSENNANVVLEFSNTSGDTYFRFLSGDTIFQPSGDFIIDTLTGATTRMLTVTSTGALSATTIDTVTPSSPLNSVQFNNNSEFSGSTNLLYDGNNLTGSSGSLIWSQIKLSGNTISDNSSLLKIYGGSGLQLLTSSGTTTVLSGGTGVIFGSGYVKNLTGNSTSYFQWDNIFLSAETITTYDSSIVVNPSTNYLLPKTDSVVVLGNTNNKFNSTITSSGHTIINGNKKINVFVNRSGFYSDIVKPTIQGISDNSYVNFEFNSKIDDSSDSGDYAAMVFSVQKNTTPISTRPLFSFENYGTVGMKMFGNYGLLIKSLEGSGTRMVVADETGVLSTQDINSGVVSPSGITYSLQFNNNGVFDGSENLLYDATNLTGFTGYLQWNNLKLFGQEISNITGGTIDFANNIKLTTLTGTTNRILYVDTNGQLYDVEDTISSGVTLQNVYNNSISEEYITVSGSGFGIRDNATPINGEILYISDSANSENYFSVSTERTLVNNNFIVDQNIGVENSTFQVSGVTVSGTTLNIYQETLSGSAKSVFINARVCGIDEINNEVIGGVIRAVVNYDGATASIVPDSDTFISRDNLSANFMILINTATIIIAVTGVDNTQYRWGITIEKQTI